MKYQITRLPRWFLHSPDAAGKYPNRRTLRTQAFRALWAIDRALDWALLRRRIKRALTVLPITKTERV